MATPNRAALITKVQKVLKKHYPPVEPNRQRSVLEQMLFACCLENARYEAAEQAFSGLSKVFFDWNEIRVSSVTELSEVMHMLPEPTIAAANLRRILQSVFESTYSFDLEGLRKQNLGPATQRLQQIGATPFVVAYTVQASLGGHSIPLDRGTLDALAVVGLINEQEREAASVPGLERAIPKSKGAQFASQLHQLGADFFANPYSPSLHKVLLEISPEAKERLPKRPAKKPAVEEERAAAPRPTPTAPAAEKEPAEKPQPAGGKKKAAPKKKPEQKPAPAKKAPAAKKTSSARLSKRKPR